MSIRNAKDVMKWSKEEVVEWLKERDLTEAVESFEKNHITGYDLCFLEKEELKNELNIKSIHYQNSILKGVKELLLDQCNYY